MTTSQTCKACSETKALEAFERLPSGGRRGVCTTCRRGTAAARKRAVREAYELTPEYRAIIVQRERDKEERAAAEEAAAAARAALLAEQEAQLAARRETARLERLEREAALRDDIWSAMNRGRSRRALQSVKDQEEGLHRISLKGGGYISIAEFACRIAERSATYRATRSCKTFETASAAIGLLERATETLERTAEVRSLWLTPPPQNACELLRGSLGGSADDEADAFDEAFGDWAPAWVQDAQLAA